MGEDFVKVCWFCLKAARLKTPDFLYFCLLRRYAREFISKRFLKLSATCLQKGEIVEGLRQKTFLSLPPSSKE